MPTVSSGPSVYGNLIFVGWPVVALVVFMVTSSIVWSAVIMIGALIAFVVAHELILRRTRLIPVTEADVRSSRRSARIFVALVVAAIALYSLLVVAPAHAQSESWVHPGPRGMCR